MTKPVRISSSKLKLWIETAQSQPQSQSLVIIDVRDEDHFGLTSNSFYKGHIRGSINVPSATFYSALPSLTASLCQTQRVVFHCQLSQQRGPTCASIYSRHVSNILPNQEIFVLDGGFNDWARMYGRDARYTEAFQPTIYE